MLDSCECVCSISVDSEVRGVHECSSTRAVSFMGAGHANHMTTEVSEHSICGDRVMAAL